MFNLSRIQALGLGLLRKSWYWLWPLLAGIVFLALLAALVRLVYQQEQDEQRETLIGDILWAEQNLRLQMQRDQEQLQKLAEELASGQLSTTDFFVRARRLQAISPELTQIAWVGADGKAIGGVPEASDTIKVWRDDPAYALAVRVGLVAYGSPYGGRPERAASSAGDSRFALFVPVPGPAQSQGVIVGVFSLPGLLQQLVPWWFTERYRLTIVDGSGEILAAKSNVEVGHGALSYSLALDPPGHDLRLNAAVYRAETGWTRYLLVALIAGLVVLLSWSLWALRRDVHRRALVERALRDEHAFRQAMEDSLHIGLRARDLEGRIVYVNRAFCEMVGWSADELVRSRTPMPYWVPEDMEQTLAAHAAVLSGQAPPDGFEMRFQRRNGERIDVLIYEAPLIDGQGHQVGWMGSVLDITERKRTAELNRQQQDRLQLTSRLVTMGEMASTLAHELNQPLAAIAGYNTACLNLLRAPAIDRTELVDALEKLGRQAQRAGQIIRRIYDFVQKSEPKLAPCDINSVIGNAVDFIEPAARRRGMHIKLDLREGLPLVEGDQLMLEQVVLNLVRNGLDAMQGQSTERRVLSVRSAVDGDTVRVSVADRGSGVAADCVDKLFTPFYTTKPEGMGMGLNICRSIIEFHDGRLWTEPQPDGGTVFYFTLPIAIHERAQAA